MVSRSTLSRRGLFRGLGTVTIATGCARSSTVRPPGVATSEDDEPIVLGPDRSPLSFTLNEKARTVEVEPRTTLLDALRLDLGHTGTKLVCDRGACGACTVLVDGVPRNSCMMLAHDVAGKSVTTVEGLGQTEALSRLQSAFVEHDALQCGFCTPGMLISSTALLRRSAGRKVTEVQVRKALAGNLCRCGTYPHVIAAVLQVANADKGGG